MSSSTEKEKCNNGDSTVKGLKKGTWSKEEDEILEAYVTKNEPKNWNSVSKNAGLSRCGRSCRLRWYNHLRPNVKKGPFSEEEERLFFELHAKLGGFKWSKMALEFPGRTDNALKNYWNARKRKYEKLGLSPFPQHIKHDDVLNKNNREQLPTLFNVSDKKVPTLVDDSNMLHNDVGSTSISNHTAPTSIDVGGIETSHTPMAMVSDLPLLPQWSYIQTMDYPSSSHNMFSGYPQITSPEETPYHHMLESISPYNNGSLQSIFNTQESGQGSDATLMRPSQINLIDERGKKPISLGNDVEANHVDLMGTDFWFDYGSYDNDNNNNLHDKLPYNVKDTLDAVIYGKSFHK